MHAITVANQHFFLPTSNKKNQFSNSTSPKHRFFKHVLGKKASAVSSMRLHCILEESMENHRLDGLQLLTKKKNQ